LATPHWKERFSNKLRFQRQEKIPPIGTLKGFASYAIKIKSLKKLVIQHSSAINNLWFCSLILTL